eukprot:7904441-Pyramimonas_sp.AAC.1
MISLLKEALKRFRHDVGFGVDGVNPRSWLLLDVSFLLRVVDILLVWEDQPELPENWPSIIIFTGKADGDGASTDSVDMLPDESLVQGPSGLSEVLGSRTCIARFLGSKR